MTRKPSTLESESLAISARRVSYPGTCSFKSSGDNARKTSSLSCTVYEDWPSFGACRPPNKAAAASCSNTGSFLLVLESRIIRRLCFSSGEKVTKIGTPYFTRKALVSKRICRRVSWVPDILRVVASALFKIRLATGDNAGTYLSFVRSPLMGIFFPSPGLT